MRAGVAFVGGIVHCPPHNMESRKARFLPPLSVSLDIKKG